MPATLQHQFLRLQDKKPQSLCQYAGKVLLVVNRFDQQLVQATGRQPLWNFHKYFVAREGRVLTSYASLTSPSDAALVRDIERELTRK